MSSGATLPGMANPLTQVQRARKRYETACDGAHQEYLDAIRAARAAGCTLEEIGTALGMTRGAVWFALNPRKDRA